MTRVQDKQKPEPLALVYIEERAATRTTNPDGAPLWVRMRRLGVPLHPVYAEQQIRLLKRHHPGAQYRLVPAQATDPDSDHNDDIPF